MEKEFLNQIDSSSQSYDAFDNFVIENSFTNPFPQTDYQCLHFVTGSHPTVYRQVRQSFLEISTRKHSIEKIIVSIKKAYLKIEKLKRDISKTDDDIEQQLLEADIQDLEADLTMWKKRKLQAELEMRYFLDAVRNLCSNNSDIAEKYLEGDPEEERKYWIARMAKQASLDIIATGRIGSGNLDSILMMPEDEQIKTLNVALKYAGAVNAGLDNIKLNAEKTIRFLGDDIPDKNYLEENSDDESRETKSLQSTDKSETFE